MATPCHAVPSRLHGLGAWSWCQAGEVQPCQHPQDPLPGRDAGAELRQTLLASLHSRLPRHASRSGCTYVKGHKLFQAVFAFPSNIAGYAVI